MVVCVTEKVIRVFSHGAGLTGRGARLLGMQYPLRGGWKRRIAGTTVVIPDDSLTPEERSRLETLSQPAAKEDVWDGVCRACNALAAVGVSVTCNVGDDELIITGLRSGKVTRMRCASFND